MASTQLNFSFKEGGGVSRNADAKFERTWKICGYRGTGIFCVRHVCVVPNVIYYTFLPPQVLEISGRGCSIMAHPHLYLVRHWGKLYPLILI